MDTSGQNGEAFRTPIALSPAELAAFVAVAQSGGFRAAARRSDLSPSALSHSVANLEARLNVQLFQRSTRNVSLTEAGQRFLSRLAPALHEIEKAVEELGDYSVAPSGTIRINADATAAEQVLRPLLLKFMASFPKVQIEIVSEGRLVDIAEHGFDCGIRSSEIVSEDMIAIPLGPMQQHIVVAAPTYLQTAPPLRSPADVAEHRCIQLRMPSGRLYRWEFEHRGKALVVETKGNLILDNSRLILAAALDGYGLGYLTRWMARSAIDQGLLVQVLSEWTPPYPGLCLYYPRHRHLSATMRAFVTYLREQASASSR
ncbi:LysR family transcriptional regulator [Rhizobium glycinendophyticum]|uniref:HTH-type transcriptional regulator TtuA n=1 Tax=Rhizobium glycinendophyticum TaxID=2589807 RepID=A0A504TVB2_9HYPH|nr:LysR family transcriptional regulator [Rhizobium glycinendophyticum]TPP05387.1 LysR family transcriptional regulator [Rhizobium glycinendophyticum]